MPTRMVMLAMSALEHTRACSPELRPVHLVTNRLYWRADLRASALRTQKKSQSLAVGAGGSGHTGNMFVCLNTEKNISKRSTNGCTPGHPPFGGAVVAHL